MLLASVQKKQSLIEFTNTEVQTLSKVFWDREMCILNMKILSKNGLKNNTFVARCIKNIKQQDKVWKESEERVVGKYFQIRTDLQYQRLLILKLLQQMLSNFKELIPQYEDNHLNFELQSLKRDMDKLKSEVKTILSNNSHNLSQTLAFLIQFSKQRLDYHVRLSENQEQEVKSNKDQSATQYNFQDVSILSKPTIHSKKFTIFQTLQKDQILCDDPQYFVKSEAKFDILESGHLKTANSQCSQKIDTIAVYYKNIFRKHQKNKSDQQTLDLSEQPIVEHPNETIKQTESDIKPTTNFSKLQRSSFLKPKSIITDNINNNGMIQHSISNHVSGHKKYKRDYSQSVVQKSSTLIESNNYERYLSNEMQRSQQPLINLDTFDPLQHYKLMNMEMKSLHQNDRRIFLLKIYKDSLRINSFIQARIDTFRGTYLLFLQKHNTQKISTSKHKSLWTKMYVTSREKNLKKPIPIALNHKEINKMQLAALEQPNLSRIQEFRIKSNDKIQRPMTSSVKFKTELIDLNKDERPQIFYCPKFKGKMQTLMTTQFDYFNL